MRVLVPNTLLCGLLGVCLGLGGTLTAAEPITTLTLDEAVRLALDRTRTVRSERLSIEESLAAEQAADSAFRPNFFLEPFAEELRSSSGSARRSAGVRARMTLGLPTGGTLGLAARASEVHPDSAGAGAVVLSFEQPLLRGAGAEVAEFDRRATRREIRRARLRLHQTAEILITAVGNAYRAWAGALRRVGLAEDALERSRERLAVNDTLIATGRMAREDRVETEAEVARREVALSEAKSHADAARRSLEDVLDLEAGTELGRPEPLALPEEPPPALSDPVSAALRHRPDVAISRLSLVQAEEVLALARDALRPTATLRLEAALDRERESFPDALSGLSEGSRRIGASVTMPLGQAARAREHLALVRAWTGLRRARLAQEELVQRVRIEVEGALSAHIRSRERLELARNALRLAERKAEVEREKLSLGVSSNFRVAAFEAERIAAEETALAALAAHLDGEAILDLALGRTLARWGVEPDSLTIPVPRGDAARVAPSG